MILGPKKLLELVKTDKLVENLSERELTNPEGAGVQEEIKGEGEDKPADGTEEGKTVEGEVVDEKK